MIVKFKGLLISNLVLFAFISMNPHFRWMVGGEVYYFLFFFSTLLLFIVGQFQNRNYFFLDAYRKRLLLVLVIFVSVFTLPLFHEFRAGHFIWYVTFIFFVFYKYEILKESYLWLKKIIVVLSAISLFYWFLSLLPVPIPYFSYNPEFRSNPNDWYKIYGPVVGLYNASDPRGGLGFERISGAFLEPGHFGMYLGFFLAVDKLNLRDKGNVILLVTGILTFSTAFYGIILIVIIYKSLTEKIVSKNMVYIPLLVISTIGIGLIFFTEEFLYGIVGRLMDNNQSANIIDSRVATSFIDEYNYFIGTPNAWFGYGFNVDLLHITNWRAMVFRYGIIGSFLMTILIIISTSRVKWSEIFLLSSVVLVIFIHRSYLLLPPTYYILTLLSVSYLYLNNRCNK